MKKIYISEVLFGSQKIQKTFLKIKFFNEFKGKTKYMYKKLLTSVKNSKIFWLFFPRNKNSIFYIFLETFFLFFTKNVCLIFDFDFLNNEKICAYKCWNKIGINLVIIGKKYKKILDNSINQTGFFFNTISVKILFLVYLFSIFFKALINIKFEKFFKKNLFIFYDSTSGRDIFKKQFSKKNKKPYINEYENIFERILEYKSFNFNYSEYDVEKSGTQTGTYEKEVNFCKYFRILSKKAPTDFCFFGNCQAKKKLDFIFKASLFLKFLKNKKLILKKKKNFNFHFFPILQFDDRMFLFSKFEWLNKANNSFEIKIFYSSKSLSRIVNENYSVNFEKKYKHERNVDNYESRKKKKKNLIFTGYLFFRPPKKHFPIFLDKIKDWEDFENDNITRLFSFIEKKKNFENFFILDKKFSEKRESGSQEFLKPKILVNLSRSSINDLILNFLLRTKDFENLRIFLIFNIFKLNPVFSLFSYIPKKKMIDCKISKKNKNFFKIFNFSFLINKIFFKNSYN